ncbi:MAG: phosphoglucosamine mutase [Oscillospiraceae bacterium]|nr:phosphoglucosamine mutase [Oscillospiraceae bacterium]
MARLFGTDGVRGVALTELTTELAMKIGMAATALLHAEPKDGERPQLIIGMDTRRSSNVLLNALVAGINAAGGDVQLIGVVPTPAVAYLVRKYGADAGIMITASHNTAEFNGIKLFDRNGFKFPDELEDEIQALVENPELLRPTLKSGGEVGTVTTVTVAVRDYSELLYSLSETAHSNLKVLVDCANGSASVMQGVLDELTEDGCVVVNHSPDGMNINDNCGSTHIEELAKQVVAGEFDLGIAFDGDADRMLAVDELGNIVDGDKIIALLSVHMKSKGELSKDTAVVTVMSNLGFHQYMKKNEIKTAVVQVGDRYVLEKMVEENYSIGGEQSGHVIFREHATTGDGLITAIKLLNYLGNKQKPLSELVAEIPTFPQTLKNVVISAENKGKWESNAAIKAAIDEVTAAAGGNSRILVRESGTEPLLRVMLEGESQELVEEWADKICAVAKRELSA